MRFSVCGQRNIEASELPAGRNSPLKYVLRTKYMFK